MRSEVATFGFGIQSHWLFAGAETADLAPLIAVSRPVQFLPDEALFREGDFADGLYLITAGAVRITAANANGEAVVLALIGANDIVGEVGVLDGGPRSGSATAVGLCRGYFVPSEPFLDVLEQSTDVGRRLLVLLTRRLRKAGGHLAELPLG